MNETKMKRGRKKGSAWHVAVTLAQLIEKFPDHNTPLPVSEKWARSKGLKYNPTSALPEVENDEIKKEVASAVSVTDFDTNE